MQDDLIRRIFAVTLDAHKIDASTDPPITMLDDLAKELKDEAEDSEWRLLTKDTLERALLARLLEDGDSQSPWQSPVPYLLGCYGRASDAFRSLNNNSDRPALEALLAHCKELAVSYTGLVLISDLFPQPEAAQERGALQLLDALQARFSRTHDSRAGESRAGDQVPMPPHFLEQFVDHLEDEGLSLVVAPIALEVSRQLVGMTAVADTAFPLSVLMLLASLPPAAKCLVTTRNFLPPLIDGRTIAQQSILGPAFCLGILSDEHNPAPPRPNVREQFLANMDSRSPATVSSTISSFRLTLESLATTLHAIVLDLLKKGTRPQTLAWLFAAVESNGERAKTMPDFRVAAPHSFFMSLAAVCIKLCQPFMQPSPKTWARLDASYVMWNDSLDFSEETKLSSSQEEQAAWKQELQQQQHVNSPQAAASQETPLPAKAPSYPFICEMFFLTAKVLHLGPITLLQQRNKMAKYHHHHEQDAAQLQEAFQSLPEPQLTMARRQHQQLTDAVDKLKGELVLMDTQLQDPVGMGAVLDYYRLMAAWLLHLASPSSFGVEDVDLPLPMPPPRGFRCLPEYFIEDMVEVLEWVAHVLPANMEKMPSEFIHFTIVFLGSADYVRNAHLRARLVDLLHIWISPQLGDADQSRQNQAIASLLHLIECQPAIQQNMVRGVLQVFLDIERTDRSNTFYEKFNTRHKAGQILCYLWGIPQHRQVWKQLAAENGGRGLYLSFCDIICNDSQYLLDDVIKTLPEMREYQDLHGTPQFLNMPRREQQEREATFRQNSSNLQTDLYLVTVYIRLMTVTTAEVTATWLLPEMVTRVAAMLCYFLDHLAGREKRKNLRVRDAAKYKWEPQELLAQLARIFLHLAGADTNGAFVAAIALDERSYHEGLFSDAADVLRKYMLLAEDEVDELESVGERAQAARLSQAAEDDELGEAPDEFLDPLTYDIMTDPVLLPQMGSSQQITMDRSSITRHLLSNTTDPFNKQPLSADQLVPDKKMRQRIQEWKTSQRGAPSA